MYTQHTRYFRGERRPMNRLPLVRDVYVVLPRRHGHVLYVHGSIPVLLLQDIRFSRSIDFDVKIL